MDPRNVGFMTYHCPPFRDTSKAYFSLTTGSKSLHGLLLAMNGEQLWKQMDLSQNTLWLVTIGRCSDREMSLGHQGEIVRRHLSNRCLP